MELAEFLVHAKLATYAAGGGAHARLIEDGGKELLFQEGPYIYRDRYYGGEPFAGEEVVLCEGRVIWAMNYYGHLTTQEVDSSAVYTFLRRALQRVQAGRPFRGPEFWIDGDWEYRDCHESTWDGKPSHGEAGCFEREEQILFRGTEVYRLVYHGGRVGAHT